MLCIHIVILTMLTNSEKQIYCRLLILPSFAFNGFAFAYWPLVIYFQVKDALIIVMFDFDSCIDRYNISHVFVFI